MELEWGPPPGDNTRSTSTKAFVAELRLRPGEWALYPRVMARYTSSGVYARNHPGTEWTSRRLPDSTVRLWARWVGVPAEKEEQT